MSSPLRLLIVEDNPMDVELMLREVRRSGFDPVWQVVDDEPSYLTSLDKPVDVILSDFTLPQFDALRALELLNARGGDTPFIIVSGSIGEDRAVSTIQKGAADYLLKDRPARLGQAIARALEERRLRLAQKSAEQQLQREVQRLAALRDVDMAISASFDIRSTLSILLEHVVTELGAQAADILRLNPLALTLDYQVGWGYAPGTPPPASQRLSDSLAGRVVLERQAVAAAVCDEPDLQARCAEEGFKTYCAVPLVAKGMVKGVLEVFLSRLLDSEAEWRESLNALAIQAAVAIDSAELFENLQRASVDLALGMEGLLEGWARAVEMRMREPPGLTTLLAEQAVRLAYELGCGEDDLGHLHRGAMLHDVGMLAVPDRVAAGRGPLDDQARAAIQRHPQIAREWLSGIAFLEPALAVPRAHHERWDGSGYPDRLHGETIPLLARVFAVVDVSHALRLDRPYRPALTEGQVREHLRSQAGVLYDPRAVDAWIAIQET
jgi:response regulator RpfG family c-di-GMP phosphodiesterase